MPSDEPSAAPIQATAAAWHLRRITPIVAMALAMIVVILMGWHRQLSLEMLVRHRVAIDGIVSQHYLVALGAFVGVYVIVVALSVPGAAVLTLSGGLLFGGVVGGLAAMVGASLGSTIVFLIARKALSEYGLRRWGDRVARIASGLRADAFHYLLFLRLVPVFPFWLVNLAPALVGVGLGTFVLATMLGIIPATLAYAFVGAGLKSVVEAQESAYTACRAAARTDCHLVFDVSAAITPQLLVGLAALGVAALVPVAIRRWRVWAGSGPED